MLKKIKTREEISRKNKQKQIIVVIILIGLMVVSTAGYSLIRGSNNNNEKHDNSKVMEKGLTFYKQGELWKVSIDGKTFGFQYTPSEVSNIPVKGFYNLEMYTNQPLYYTDTGSGIIEILNNMGSYVLRYQEACLNKSNCKENLPTKNCDNNIIITKTGNKTEVYNNKNCVYLVGDSIKAADAFLYKVLKV